MVKVKEIGEIFDAAIDYIREKGGSVETIIDRERFIIMTKKERDRLVEAKKECEYLRNALIKIVQAPLSDDKNKLWSYANEALKDKEAEDA